MGIRDYDALHRKWDKWQAAQGLPKPPHDDWHHQGFEDLGVPDGQCDMCGKLYCRYMHHVTHPEWFGGERLMIAGSECIEAMIRDSDMDAFDKGERSMQAAVRQEVARVKREKHEAERQKQARIDAEARAAQAKRDAEAAAIRWAAEAPARAAAAAAEAAYQKQRAAEAAEAERKWRAEAPLRAEQARAEQARAAQARARQAEMERESARQREAAEKQTREHVVALLYAGLQRHVDPATVLPDAGYRRTAKGWRRWDGTMLYERPDGKVGVCQNDTWWAGRYDNLLMPACIIAAREAGVDI